MLPGATIQGQPPPPPQKQSQKQSQKPQPQSQKPPPQTTHPPTLHQQNHPPPPPPPLTTTTATTTATARATAMMIVVPPATLTPRPRQQTIATLPRKTKRLWLSRCVGVGDNTTSICVQMTFTHGRFVVLICRDLSFLVLS